VTYHGRKESFITAPSKQPQDPIWKCLMMRSEVQEVCSALLVILRVRDRFRTDMLMEEGATQERDIDRPIVVQTFMAGGVMKSLLR
jgi:hypothetical protein